MKELNKDYKKPEFDVVEYPMDDILTKTVEACTCNVFGWGGGNDNPGGGNPR